MAIVMDIEGVTAAGDIRITVLKRRYPSKSRILKTRWTGYTDYNRKLTMQKKHYQHFIKVYNRRTKQKMSHLSDLGYTCIRVNPAMKCAARQAKAYCKKYIKDGAWISNGDHFIFAYDKDVTLFTLKFA
jgi:hypothetical protein